MSNILDEYAPFKKITKHKRKLRTKPSITPALQKSISIKNKTYIKEEVITHNNYKKSHLNTDEKK